ncbi:GntR family transcriptional regulator [Microbacterium sp. 18062]|uniref:GntR family transcriptional regulator n=1 Tax=Microbacterium sp. 18062 TaxID=2681410 RepID=UPI00135C2BA0|nr:GntR family transcriptional regulator [Microbacterium sp. 18062]
MADATVLSSWLRTGADAGGVDCGDAGTSAQRIADALRIAMREGGLVPGQRLIEAEVAEQFDVSRATVREAILRLDEAGLVTTLRYRGAQVRRVDRACAADLVSLLTPVQVHAAALACTSRTAGDMTRMNELVGEVAQAARFALWGRVAVLDRVLDRTIARSTRNTALVDTVDSLQLQLCLHRLRPSALVRIGDDMADREGVVDAIGRRDREDAQRHEHSRRLRLEALFGRTRA